MENLIDKILEQFEIDSIPVYDIDRVKGYIEDYYCELFKEAREEVKERVKKLNRYIDMLESDIGLLPTKQDIIYCFRDKVMEIFGNNE